MASAQQPPEGRPPGAYVVAAVLIVLGMIGLAADYLGGDQVIVLAVGLVFLAVYLWNRRYGFLVPGGILTGLGAGLAAGMASGGAEPVLVPAGLGAGFLLIYALDLLVSGGVERWWPLIPGSILLVFGPFDGAGASGAPRAAAFWPPLVLVAFGILIVAGLTWRRGGRRGKSSS